MSPARPVGRRSSAVKATTRPTAIAAGHGPATPAITAAPITNSSHGTRDGDGRRPERRAAWRPIALPARSWPLRRRAERRRGRSGRGPRRSTRRATSQAAPRSTEMPSWRRTPRRRALAALLRRRVIRSILSSSWDGSWWNNARRLTPWPPTPPDTAYSTVQWPHVRFCSNSLGVYCASWISRSTPRHSSSDDSAIVVVDRRAADGR